jgi:hypothetical protein
MYNLCFNMPHPILDGKPPIVHPDTRGLMLKALRISFITATSMGTLFKGWVKNCFNVISSFWSQHVKSEGNSLQRSPVNIRFIATPSHGMTLVEKPYGYLDHHGPR